ncbi:MAG TPA: hypothetical protein DCZ72_06095 [Armatimonadetes bacterium]|nr:hypothetical protein [Armatimonadota bacterium]
MSWLDRIRRAAAKAAGQAAEGAERLAKQVAASNTGFIAEGAQELLAEREYHRARELATDSLDRDKAAQVIEILTPYADVDCAHNVLIAKLLADAHNALDQDEQAFAAYNQALRLLRDPRQAMDSERQILDDQELLSHEFEADLLLKVAALSLALGDPANCYQTAAEAQRLDRNAHLAYYLQAAGLLGRGRPADLVMDLFVKALGEVPADTVRGWVRDLMPDQAEQFERLAL